VAARSAVRTTPLEAQRTLLEKLRGDVALLGMDLRTFDAAVQSEDGRAAAAGMASSVRTKTDELTDEARAAESRITDAGLRSQLRSDVIDVVAKFRGSAAYQASSPTGFLAQDR
jgi:hypothetical protein